jgi:excisionase family DNA binding protein
LNAAGHWWSAAVNEAKMDSTPREALAVREFCAFYGICRQTFYDEVRRGRLRALKVGRKTVVLKSDAEAWRNSLPPLKLAATA